MAFNLFKFDKPESIENPNMEENASAKFPYKVSLNRIKIILIIFLIMIALIFIRLVTLQIFEAQANTEAAIDTRTISYKVAPKRGTIYDRNGNVLAYSKEAKTVYANPSEIDNDNDTASKLAKHLGGDISDYTDMISDHSKKFVYIKRRIDTEVGDELNKENLKGIYLQEDQKRIYPYGRCAGQIIGACNIDGDGMCGLELYYDDVLRGSTGKTVRQQGNQGMPIPGGTLQEIAVIDGQDIMISVDVELQQKMEETLESWNQKIGTTSMHSILMDPTNGEIYAAASLPLLNPADLSKAEDGATDLKCISTTFEPGSTFKTVSATSMLENNAITPDTEIYCPNIIQADEYYIKDAHDRASQTYTFRQIIEESSNVGISLATEKMGYDKLYDKIIRYNLNKKTGVDYPGDTSGYLLDYNKWSKVNAYNISFGQGVTVTPLEMTRFYAGIAVGGVEKTPHFLMRYLQAEKDEQYSEEDVIDNKAALPVVVDLLRSVVINGTGQLAKIDGYGVAGKTGTGEIADSNGKYISGAYYSSFVGYLSQASVPMLCFVGGEKAPPETSVTQVWKDIMTMTIERLKIAGQE